MTTYVMPALVAGIHAFGKARRDGRDKPGHDNVKRRLNPPILGIVAWTPKS